MARQDRREFMSMKDGPAYKAASDDSSSLYHKPMGLNTQALADKWRTEEYYKSDLQAGMSSSSAKGFMRIPTGKMTKEQRRDLRKMLRVELNKVQGLSSKLEARELQLRRQSQPAEMYPYLSDVEFSRNDVRSDGGRELASRHSPHDVGLRKQQSITKNYSIPTEYSGTEGAPELPRLSRASPCLSPHVSKQKSYTENGGTLTDAELSQGKSTPIFNSDFATGSNNVYPLVKSNLKHPSTATKHVASSADGWYLKRKLGVLSKKHSEFMSQCRSILKKLMGHRDGWVFNKPVDAVTLGLSDYHRVIEKPMDLGTIKSKLDKKQYCSEKQFANDVRLTFHNAMKYNPQGHAVYKMADGLQRLFEENWKVVNQKIECRAGEGELKVMSCQVGRAPGSPPANIDCPDHPGFPFGPKANKKMALNSNGVLNKSKASARPKAIDKPEASSNPKPSARPAVNSEPKRNMSYPEKANLVGSLQLLPAKMQDDIIRLMKERNPALDQEDDEMEVDIDSFDNETLWELDQYVKNCLKIVDASKTATVQKSPPMGSNGGQNASKKRKVVAHKSTGVGNIPNFSWSSSSQSRSSDADSESSV